MERGLVVFGVLVLGLVGFVSGAFSNWGNSSGLEILNSLPVVTLISPGDWNDTTNRSLEFVWNGTDADGDNLTYEYRIEEGYFSGDGTSCDDYRNDNSVSDEFYIASPDLKCLYDNGYYYNWSVRANDGTGWGEWSSVWHFNVSAVVNISLVSSSIEFGSMSPGEVNDTTVASLNPFVIDNDGNVLTNVSVNSSALWESETSNSSYYQFKVDNVTGEEGAFSWLESIVSWFNIPITGDVVGVAGLDYHTGNDSAETDIRLEVPASEGPGVKNATIVFTGRLAE